MNQELKKQTSKSQKIFLWISHILSLVLFVMIFLWSSNTNKTDKYLGGLDFTDNIFNWHPFLMTSGMVVLSTQGILAYRTWAIGKRLNKLLHFSFQSLGVIFIGGGLIAVFKSHNDPNKPIANLYSLHSWIGMTTVVIYITQFSIGYIVFYSGLISNTFKAYFLPVHIIAGISSYVLSGLACETGIVEKTSWLGCSYLVTKIDTNPMLHYFDIPEGCRFSNGIGLIILILIPCTLFSIIDKTNNTSEDSNERYPLLDEKINNNVL